MTAQDPDLSPPTTRARLIRAAAHLFQRNGYHGVGLTEILAEAKAPKGSLYHHFPNGKSDLAIAAAEWAGAQVRQVIDDAFGQAASFEDGCTTVCYKLAKLFEITGKVDGCPVSNTLFEGPHNPAFRAKAAEIFETWKGSVSRYARQHGLTDQIAEDRAEALLIGLEGAWVIARARQSAEPLRALPRLMGLR